MAIGLACGSMNFILAITATLLIILVLTAFRTFEARLNKKAPLFIVKAKPNTPVVSTLLEIAKKYDCFINDLQVELAEEGGVEVTFLAFPANKEFRSSEFICSLEAVEGVTQVSIVNGHKF